MALVKCKECGKEISKKATSCPNCGAKPRRTSAFTWLIAVLVVLWMIGHFSNREATSSSSTAVAVDPKEDAANKVHIVKFNGHKGGFNAVFLADFTIKNDSAYPIKDIEISCKDAANSGTVIDSNNQTIYDVVKAHSTRKFTNVSMGFIHSQATSAHCEISDFKIAN